MTDSKDTITLYVNADFSAGTLSAPIFTNKHSQIEIYGDADGSGFFGLRVSSDNKEYSSTPMVVHYQGSIYGIFPAISPNIKLYFPLDMSGLNLKATLS